MKTNILSALVLASVVSLSVACVNTSPNGNISNEELVIDAQSDSNTDATNTSGTKNKPFSTADKLVIPPSDMPYDASYEEWAAAYWQWAMAIPAEKNPFLDGPCEQDQSGKVFFLAGNMGGGHQRSCTVPRGKGIFIPVFTSVARICPEVANNSKECQNFASENGIRVEAETTIDSANPVLRLVIDGQVVHGLDQYRVQSALFSDTSPENQEERLFQTCSGPIEANLCQMAESQTRSAVTDGYFVMLRQLSDGPHEIEIAANVAPGSTVPPFEVTYHIFVSATNPSGSE